MNGTAGTVALAEKPWYISERDFTSVKKVMRKRGSYDSLNLEMLCNGDKMGKTTSVMNHCAKSEIHDLYLYMSFNENNSNHYF